MDVECPVCGTKGVWSSTDAGGEPGSGQHAPRFLGPGGEHSEGSLRRSRAGSELLLCRGPAAPREAHVCPGCSERAWAGSLPRGLALARHSCRLDTMILTQIPHT